MNDQIKFCELMANELFMNVICFDHTNINLNQTQLEYNNHISIILDYIINELQSNKLYFIINGKIANITIKYIANNDWNLPVVLINPNYNLKIVDGMYKFNTSDYIDKIKCSILILHNINDDLINMDYSIKIKNYLKNKNIESNLILFMKLKMI